MKSERLCSVENCRWPSHNASFCSAHAAQIRNHGRITNVVVKRRKNSPAKCTVDRCTVFARRNGMCGRHDQQIRTHGSITTEHTPWGRKKPIAETHQHLMNEMVIGNPLVLTPGSAFRATWQCDRGHQWQCSVSSRALGGHGCPKCAIAKAAYDRRGKIKKASLLVTDPLVAKEALFDPSKVSRWSQIKAFWKCSKCNYIYASQIRNRVIAKTGCPQCSKSTYDPAKAAWLYLVERPGQLKIGITNIVDGIGSRLAFHKRSGWKQIDILGPHDGGYIRHLEKRIKHALDKKGIPRGADAFRERFGGFTEAWQTVDLDVPTIKDLLDYLGLNGAEYGTRQEANQEQHPQIVTGPAEGFAGGCSEVLDQATRKNQSNIRHRRGGRRSRGSHYGGSSACQGRGHATGGIQRTFHFG